MPRLPKGYGFRARVGHGVPARGHAYQRSGRRNFTNRGYRCAKAERLLRVLRLAALQQTPVQAGHDRHLRWHSRRSIRLQAAGCDLRIARACLGSPGSGAAQAPEHAALAIAVVALHLPVDIIQLAIRSDSGVGESRLEVAMMRDCRSKRTPERRYQPGCQTGWLVCRLMIYPLNKGSLPVCNRDVRNYERRYHECNSSSAYGMAIVGGSIDEQCNAPRTSAADNDVIRRLRHVDQRSRQLLRSLCTNPCRCRRAPSRRQGVLGMLGTSEYRALLGPLPVVSRYLRTLTRRDIRAFRDGGRQPTDQSLL